MAAALRPSLPSLRRLTPRRPPAAGALLHGRRRPRKMNMRDMIAFHCREVRRALIIKVFRRKINASCRHQAPGYY